MDAEWKARWVEALRSGRYKQGRDQLRTEHDEFCCLGVLCDIVAPDEWRELPAHGWTSFDEEDGALPQEVADAVGLDRRNPPLGLFVASIHNDGAGEAVKPKSFTEIADLIERFL